MAAKKKLPSRAIVGLYRKHRTRKNISKNMIENETRTLWRFAEFLAPKHILNAKYTDVEAWLDSLGDDVSASTQATYIHRLASFYKWTLREDLIVKDPMVKIDAPKVPQRLPRPIPNDILLEVWRTVSVSDDLADRRAAAMLAVAAYQGFRCGGLSALNAEDIDAEAMTVRVVEKGDKERMLSMNAEALRALRRYWQAMRRQQPQAQARPARVGGVLPERGPVFISHRPYDWGQRLGARHIGHLISELLPDDITAHKLRAWFATNFYDRSGDVLLTMAHLGHASPNTTMRYTKVNVEKGRPFIDGLEIT